MRASLSVCVLLLCGCPSPSQPDASGTEGTIVSADGVLTLVVPPGALPAGVAMSELRITPNTSPKVAALNVTAAQARAGTFTDADKVAPLAAYTLEPDGLVFTTPALMTVRLPSARATELSSVTLNGNGQLEYPNLTDLRLTETELELDLEVPHFSELDLWRAGPVPRFEATLTPALEGSMHPLSAPFGEQWDTTLHTGSEEVKFNLEAIIITRVSTTSNWLLRGLLQFGEKVTPNLIKPGNKVVPGTTQTIPYVFGNATCVAEGPTWAASGVSVSYDLEVTRVPMVDGLPGTPEQPTVKPGWNVRMLPWPTTLHCVAPATACTGLIGAWSSVASFTPRANTCGTTPYTDRLNVTLDPAGGAVITQPSTSDVNTGTAQRQGTTCVIDAANANGRERYSLSCDLSTRACTGTNDYTSVTSCQTISDVTMTLAMGGGAGGGTGGGGGSGGGSGGGGGGATGGGAGGGGGSSTFITLTPDTGPVSAELAARLGSNHAGSVQQRLVGSARVASGSVVVLDNPAGGATKLVGLVATFAAGTARGAFSHSRQPTTPFNCGAHVVGGERWALVTKIDAGQRLTLERFSGTGPLEASSLEVVVLGDYTPEFTVSETAPMKLFEYSGPDLCPIGALIMTMSAGGTDPAMLGKICPSGASCTNPMPVGRNTLPASMGGMVAPNDTFTISPTDRSGDVSPLTATFTLALSVPSTGPFRIIWNRL